MTRKKEKEHKKSGVWSTGVEIIKSFRVIAKMIGAIVIFVITPEQKFDS